MSPVRPPVDVMLARAVQALPPASALPGGVHYEQKWDRYRLVAFTSPRPYLQSRRAADLTAGFPEIAEAVASLPDVVVDGELVIWGDGALHFPALLQRMASTGTRARQLAMDGVPIAGVADAPIGDDQASISESTRGGFVTNPAVGAAIVWLVWSAMNGLSQRWSWL